MGLRDIKAVIAGCEDCRLHKTRTNTVPGVGYRKSTIMVIGEAPGEKEDKYGKPFIGRSGMLLRETLVNAGFDIRNTFINNTVCCRPPENRNPHSDEFEACKKYLKRKIRLIKPKLIILVGAVPTKYILLDEEPTKLTFSEVRNKFLTRSVFGVTTILAPIYHPAYILRNQYLKGQYLKDLKQVRHFSY